MAVTEWTEVRIDNGSWSCSRYYSESKKQYYSDESIKVTCFYRVNGRNAEYKFEYSNSRAGINCEITVPYPGGTVKSSGTAKGTLEGYSVPLKELAAGVTKGYCRHRRYTRGTAGSAWDAAYQTHTFDLPVPEVKPMAKAMIGGQIVECNMQGIEAVYVLKNGELVEVGV